MIKGNTFILILVTTMFVSCKFYRSDDANKKNTSLSRATMGIGNIGSGILLEQVGNKKGDTAASKVALAQVTGHANSELMLDNPYSNVSKYNQEKTISKLTEEDMDKLKVFFRKTITYQGILNSIYNKYTRSYNTIATYSGCANYNSIECFSGGPSARRSQALNDLEKNKLDREYTKLSQMLKETTHDYCPKALDNAIEEYKKTITIAKEAENKIKKITSFTIDEGNNNEERKENVDNLKKVSNILSISEKTIETASVAYANAFAVIASRLSSAKFITAVNEFKDAAEKYANGNKGDHAVDVVVGAIAGIAFDNENKFERAKMFANKEKGEEVNKMIAAIEKLRATYNTVKPKNKDK
ncbi:hypothetical protein QIA01_04930 (plasmid) [Borreliella americana]